MCDISAGLSCCCFLFLVWQNLTQTIVAIAAVVNMKVTRMMRRTIQIVPHCSVAIEGLLSEAVFRIWIKTILRAAKTLSLAVMSNTWYVSWLGRLTVMIAADPFSSLLSIKYSALASCIVLKKFILSKTVC